MVLGSINKCVTFLMGQTNVGATDWSPLMALIKNYANWQGRATTSRPYKHSLFFALNNHPNVYISQQKTAATSTTIQI